MAYQSHHCSAMLLCSPVSVSLCLHLLALSDLLLFSTSAPQPSFTVSTIHLCSFFCCTLCSACHVPPMHHSSSGHFSCCTLPPSTHLNHSQQPPISSLVVLLYSVCIICILYSQCFCMLSPCRVFCLIIIATLQLLWLLNPCVHITECYAEIP
jgi:hypothetical protein